MGDAITRTLTRLFVTRRHLLEWVPAAQAAIGPQPDLLGFYRRMAGAVIIAVVAVIVALAWGWGTWPLVLPFAALWIASPAVARWISRSSLVTNRLSISDGDARTLRLTARRTWRFFETFVTPADQMLPPDNFQEEPAGVLAHRTSPTNLGLYLLSVVSARDLGWTGTIDAIERLEATLSTMNQLARFRGHFYNWYDTRTLRPLDPDTYLPSTAAIWPGISSPSPMRAGNGPFTRSRTSGVLPVSQTRSSSCAKRRAGCARVAERRRWRGVSWMRRSPCWPSTCAEHPSTERRSLNVSRRSRSTPRP